MVHCCTGWDSCSGTYYLVLLQDRTIILALCMGSDNAFSVFMNLFYSELIVPLFNKQTPLENGSLRDQIEAFAEKSGFRLKNIYIIDGSKRSTKANAYFSGFGPKKRIVLYDTLLNELTAEEIVAVLAHEIGHYKKKHVIAITYILSSHYRLDVVSVFPCSKHLLHFRKLWDQKIQVFIWA